VALRRVALAATALALAGAGRPAGLGEVSDLRHWSYADYTRVVVELTRAADAAGSALAPGGGAPARLYFDLPGIWVGTSRDEPIPVGDGLLRRVRVGQNTLDTTRVVLDLERPGRYRVLRLAGPERVVIDVFADAGPGARRRARATPPMDLRPVRTVVLDAGHGGEDPGAIGVSGLREKDVALRLARLLRPRLVARGFEVVLTRDGDRTLSLLERTALAEGAGGDVLVSLHANAARNRRAAGVEIYTLDEDAQRQTLRLAARENGVALAELDPLQRLLTRLRVAEASQRSERLADLAQREIVSGMAGRWPSVRGPGRRRGPFYVLYLSDMPAILVEAGFVTHRGDARRLRDPDYLEALAEEIADALVRFRDGAGPLVAEARP
jgi:N-acetylmuramoyl-L-alanine amidase